MARETGSQQILANVAISVGILEADLDKLDRILERCPELLFICLDVSERLFRTVRCWREPGPGAASR